MLQEKVFLLLIQIQYLFPKASLVVIVFHKKTIVINHAEHVVELASSKLSIKIRRIKVKGAKVKDQVSTVRPDFSKADGAVSKRRIQLRSRICSKQTYFPELRFCGT